MIDAVIDTNVLVAALRSSPGASHRLLQTVELRVWRPVISSTLALEYETVLKRGVGQSGLTAQDVDDLVEYLCSRARLVQIYFGWLGWRPALPDPDDDRILEAAFRLGAPIVTFNAKDFRGCEKFGIRTMRPAEFLATLEDRR